MSFPRYEAYKDSGVEWLGEIPGHWEMSPLYSRYAQVLGKMVDQNKVTGMHPIPYIRNVDVQWDSVNADNLPIIDIQPSEHCRFTVNRGDLLICEGGEIGRTAIWKGGDGEVAFQKAIHRLRPFDESENVRFFFHTMQFATAMQVFLANSNPNTIPHLTGEQLRGYRLPKPPKVEQDAIASFLDVETSKIDALVAEQRRLIELLKEKRQAVISHAVTKGLDPNVKMKPSGIEWLGDVPEHWQMKRLKRISPFISVGIVVNPSSYISESPDDLPFIYRGDIREGVIDWPNSRRISASASALQEKTRLQTDDLLVVRVGAPGVTAVVPQACEGGNCASVMLVRKGSFSSQWLCYVMNTPVVRFQVEVVEYGAAQKQFNIAHAVDFRVPVPGRAEQDRIAAHLNERIGEFKHLQIEAERAITLLQERRTALISAAVTGKIDVRSFADKEVA
jgi:type I restriction enzyme S subunit